MQLEDMMKIIVGCDHAGLALKQAVVEHLAQAGNEVKDVGTHSAEPCDYADIIPGVVEGLLKGGFERGVLVCGTGQGMTIGANRYRGIRATLVFDLFAAEMARKHNDSNLLVLAGMITAPPLAKRIVDVWLATPFEGGRHQRRIDKLDRMG
jgi:ribose 5-phosphate isomerase B